MPESTEALVLEMGMSDFHEIEFLSKLARPEVVAITLIGESHMEQLEARKALPKPNSKSFLDYKKMELLFIQRMKS